MNKDDIRDIDSELFECYLSGKWKGFDISYRVFMTIFYALQDPIERKI